MARRLAQLVELLAQLVRDAERQPLDLQHHAGERLADLVVQLARDAPPLGLLDQQRPPGALAALGLQPVEHVVERARERGDVRIPGISRPCAGPERVVPAHGVGQLVERRERRLQQHQVGRQQRDQAHGQHEQLARADRHGHGHRREHEPDERQHQHAGVGGEHAPEQRKGSDTPVHPTQLRMRSTARVYAV